ncbi:MAG: hypothetical protein H0V82_08440 [Candidatus Protochlamydia sp.]|nr:hypothetical protein [Candidatus Protochlamydia sp.]
MNYFSSLTGAFTNLVCAMTGGITLQGNENDKELEEKIFNIFEEQITPQYQHDTINPKVLPKKFYVCFKQSESWTKFTQAITNIEQQQLEFNERNVINFWKQMIKNINLAYISLGINNPTEIREEAKERLKILYKEAERQIQNNCREFLTNPQNKNPRIVEFVGELSFAWQKLWVFREWSEISLDSSKMHVKIFEINNNENLDMQQYVSFSTKCIVGIKERDLYCKPKEVNGQNFMVCVPEKIEIFQDFYGPLTPYSIERTNANNNEITAQAEKLSRITLSALERVNHKLAFTIQNDKMQRYTPRLL